MKNLFKNLMLVAVAAMGFTACEQVIDDVNATNETFKVNIVGEFADDTRSGFIGSETVDGKTLYKSAWDGNETAVFSLDEADLVSADNTYKDGGNKASFAPKFKEAKGSTIYAFSPEGVYDKNDASKCEGGVTGIKADYDDVYVVVPAVQTPRQNSVDPAAHILAGKADFAENVNMTFNHVVAYGKMQIKNFTGTIDKVEITASKPLAGTGCYYYYAGENEGKLTNATGNIITLISTNVDDDDKVFWFGCAPADLTDTTLKVKIYSGEDTYTRNVAINRTLKFQQGHVASFGVNMAGIEADVKEEVVDPTTLTYTLVTDVADLAVGDKVIIVASDFDVAMSTNQKSSNRGQIAVEKSGNTIAYVDGIQILTLEAGTKDDTFAFNTGSGYLYAASSSSNNLKTQATNNDNGSWSITIAADGTATIKAQGSYTRNWMRYNDSSELFSCYGSGQKDICIYKGVEAGTDEPDQPGGGDEPEQPGGGDEPEQPGEGGAKTWVRVTSTDMILSGGTFIIGYEATAKSGKLVPMRSDASGAKTTANGYHYSGTGTGTTSNNGTIDMTTIDVTKTEKYEFTISASTNVSGAIDIKRPDGNYIGNNNGKNTARLFTAPSEKTAYGVSMGSNDVVTLTCAAATGYPTLQYNASSPRFANYNKSQKNLVLYKLQ